MVDSLLLMQIQVFQILAVEVVVLAALEMDMLAQDSQVSEVLEL